MKYIDADRLRAEIERRMEETKSMKPSFDQFWAGQISAFKGCLNFIDSLQHIGIVNELIDQKGVAIVDTIDNYSGYQTINTIRFVGEDDDKPKPMPCKYYHVWLKAAKEEDL